MAEIIIIFYQELLQYNYHYDDNNSIYIYFSLQTSTKGYPGAGLQTIQDTQYESHLPKHLPHLVLRKET